MGKEDNSQIEKRSRRVRRKKKSLDKCTDKSHLSELAYFGCSLTKEAFFNHKTTQKNHKKRIPNKASAVNKKKLKFNFLPYLFDPKLKPKKYERCKDFGRKYILLEKTHCLSGKQRRGWCAVSFEQS